MTRSKQLHAEYTGMSGFGISGAHRELLAQLRRVWTGPFTVEDATETLGTPRTRTMRLLAYWAQRGWLSRVRRGVFITVPFEVTKPSQWREDPWVAATALFNPCYIGGWSAAEHWGLTEQIFRDVVVFTTRQIRRRNATIQGMPVRLATTTPKRLFGLAPVWRGSNKVMVSDPSRTLVDMLDTPALGGGIRHVFDVLGEYVESEKRDDHALADYILRLGNRTVCKRLGYMLDRRGVAAPELLAFCRKNLSAGYSKLDPSVSRKGRLLRKWRLVVNASLPSSAVQS